MSRPESTPFMETISGVRGIASKSITPLTVVSYVAAFSHLLHPRKVIVGRDSRISGSWLHSIAIHTLASSGIHVVDLGIVPTPTVQLIVIQEKADGGIILTSSHNPIEWNGMKFVGSDGLFLTNDQCEKLFSLRRQNDPWYQVEGQQNGESGKVEYLDAVSRHIDTILSLPYIKPSVTSKCNFKVVLDSINGAGGIIMKELLTKLGCTVIGLNLTMDGRFAHPPEPIPEHLGQLSNSVKENKADFGIAVDPDVDRCVFIDENGNPIGEEYTLGMAVKFILGHVGRRGIVCKNLSSSRCVDDIASSYGCPTIATPVGEISVASRMVTLNAVIGGEGNGGVMLPDVHIGRDAPVAAALAIQLLAETGLTLSQLKASLPQYHILKMKVSIEGLNADSVIHHYKEKWEANPQGATLNHEDGLHISTAEWWVHLRKSNTEPIIRVIGESRTPEESLKVCQKFINEIVAMKS